MSTSRKQSDYNPVKKLDWFRKIGIWCSGASWEALKDCPSDWNKFAFNGHIIGLTASLAILSGSYFLSFVFPESHWIIPALFGILWGFLIFTLDRIIIVSMKKEGGIRLQLIRGGLWRIILALFIGLVIATPIELRLFDREIMAKVEDNNRIREEQIITQTNTNLNKHLQPLQKQLSEFQKIRDDYYRADSICTAEIEGLSATGKIGRGPAWQEKENTRQEKLMAWENSKSKYEELQTQIHQLIQQPSAADTKKEANIDGAEARVKALYQLSGLHWFITLLFILIECLPAITKLMTPRSSYDETLERIEYEKMIEQKEIISQKNAEINELMRQAEEAAKLSGNIMLRKAKDKLDIELQTNKTILKTIAKYQQELALLAIEKWREEELKKINSDNIKGQYL